MGAGLREAMPLKLSIIIANAASCATPSPAGVMQHLSFQASVCKVDDKAFSTQ